MGQRWEELASVASRSHTRSERPRSAAIAPRAGQPFPGRFAIGPDAVRSPPGRLDMHLFARFTNRIDGRRRRPGAAGVRSAATSAVASPGYFVERRALGERRMRSRSRRRGALGPDDVTQPASSGWLSEIPAKDDRNSEQRHGFAARDASPRFNPESLRRSECDATTQRCHEATSPGTTVVSRHERAMGRARRHGRGPCLRALHARQESKRAMATSATATALCASRQASDGTRRARKRRIVNGVSEMHVSATARSRVLPSATWQ